MKETKNLSAIDADGRLNVSIIQRNVANDIAMDKQHHSEDGMKKRAIHMSKNYDEFKSFVACSNLQPVKRDEMSQLFTSTESRISMNQNRPNKVLNSSSEIDRTTKKLLEGLGINSSTSNKQQSSTIIQSSQRRPGSSMDLSKVPTTFMELEKEWRYFCTTVDTALQYILLPIGSSINSMEKSHFSVPVNLRLCPEYVCCKLCKVEMSSSIFGDLIVALYSFLESSDQGERTKDYISSDEDICKDDANATQSSILFVFQWIKYLRQAGGFDLNIAFLTDNQKRLLGKLFEIMDKFLLRRPPIGNHQDDYAVNASSDDEKCLIELRQLYKVT
jgi:hypothetical protein